MNIKHNYSGLKCACYYIDTTTYVVNMQYIYVTLHNLSTLNFHVHINLCFEKCTWNYFYWNKLYYLRRGNTYHRESTYTHQYENFLSS